MTDRLACTVSGCTHAPTHRIRWPGHEPELMCEYHEEGAASAARDHRRPSRPADGAAVKALTAGQYLALIALEEAKARGIVARNARSPEAQAVIDRGLVTREPCVCERCGRMHDMQLAVTPLGRTAMRCYELATRPLDLGALT